MSSCTGAGSGGGGSGAAGGGVEGSGDGEEVVKSSLVSDEEGRGRMPLCRCEDSITGELEVGGDSGG